MRDLKFRCWSSEGKQFVPVETTFFTGDDGIGSLIVPKELIFSQYTGLHDKNGKEIYEGDIFNDVGVVRWNNDRAYFYIHYPDCDIGFPSGEKPGRFEVIGNIYENPEL